VERRKEIGVTASGNYHCGIYESRDHASNDVAPRDKYVVKPEVIT
jgi:hypothetical protein